MESKEKKVERLTRKISEETEEIKKILIKDKEGLMYGLCKKGTNVMGFSLNYGPMTTKIYGLFAFRLVYPTEIRTQDFTMMRYMQKIKHPNRFVETGCDQGAMIEVVRKTFKEIYSVEIDRKRYERAKERFKEYPHIHLIHGDSGKLLPEEADLYWLDAHSSPHVEGTKVLPCHLTGACPLMDELKRIKDFEYILIDDVTMMTGKHSFPAFSEIINFVKEKWGVSCYVENEIIVIDRENKWVKNT